MDNLIDDSFSVLYFSKPLPHVISHENMWKPPTLTFDHIGNTVCHTSKELVDFYCDGILGRYGDDRYMGFLYFNRGTSLSTQGYKWHRNNVVGSILFLDTSIYLLTYFFNTIYTCYLVISLNFSLYHVKHRVPTCTSYNTIHLIRCVFFRLWRTKITLKSLFFSLWHTSLFLILSLMVPVPPPSLPLYIHFNIFYLFGSLEYMSYPWHQLL